MSALDSDHSYGFALLQPVGGGDLDSDLPVPNGYNPGAVLFAYSPFGGIRLYRYVQNRHTAAVVKGALLAATGDTDGKTQVTTTGGAPANTKVKATVSGLTANEHQGNALYIQNSLSGVGTAPEGEETIVSGNSATEVFIEPGNPLSATITSGDTINLAGMYSSKLSLVGHLGYAVAGVVVGKNGISPNNYGWVACQGRTPNALFVASTAAVQNGAVVAAAGRVGPGTGTTPGNLEIGTTPNVMNADSVPDKTTVILTIGLGYSPATAATSGLRAAPESEPEKSDEQRKADEKAEKEAAKAAEKEKAAQEKEDDEKEKEKRDARQQQPSRRF